MVKPLVFKGDKKKKRKREAPEAPEVSAPREEADKRVATGAGATPTTDDDDSWVSADAVSDVSGPVLLVLPTTPPASLACDANGSVFAMTVENIVDDNPASAEPHDVRQVWVAIRVGDVFQFKGHHGKYLGCDKGKLVAKAQAVSPLESFTLLDDHDGRFRLKAHDAKFIDQDCRGDADEGATLRIRMQARFKPRLQQDKAERAREKISRRELEDAAGRRLEDDEVRRLKRARREGDYHEQLLMLKVKNKHDKFS